MPRVTPPEDSESLQSRMGATQPPTIGHHLISEHRIASFLDPAPERPGRMAVWSRLTGPLATSSPQMTPAVIAFLADLVPLAVSAAAGVAGAGTSLDNSLRVGEAVDSEWVLLEVDADVAVGGYGHGHVRIWSPDGHMVAVGTQSARMFSFEEFARHLSG